MTQESYSLREVADVLGVSRRTLQRRLQEGAFPGRFLALGRDGLEIRVPADDVRHLVEAPGASGAGPGDEWSASGRRGQSRSQDSLVPYGPEVSSAGSGPPLYTSALTSSDLESLRDAMLAIVREERASFMGAVRDALEARDQEIARLRAEVERARDAVDRMGQSLESVERTVAAAWRASAVEPWSWAEALGGPEPEGVDVDRLLRELGELEALFAGPH